MFLRGIIRTIKCHIGSTQEPIGDESLVLPWLVEHAGCIMSRCQKGRDGKTQSERLHGKKPTQEFVAFGEKVLAKQTTTDPMNRTNRMNPRYKYGMWLDCETTAQNASFGMQMVCSELVKSEGWNLGVDGTQKPSTVDQNPSFAIRESTNPEGKTHQARRRRIRSHHWMIRLHQRQQEGTSPLRSLQNENRRMPQSHSTRSRKIGSKK